MEEYPVKITNIEKLTHNVKHFVVERPDGYHFSPGQATEVSINKPEWKNEKRPFTFTGLTAAKQLEFTIKIYPPHKGVTNELDSLKVGDELIIHDVWGAISYKGKGVFIAGGAGVTPFIAILRDLHKKNQIAGHQLIFSNKTSTDIILKEEFEKILGNNFINVLTQEEKSGIHFGRLDKNYLKTQIKDFQQHFYVCGPEKFVESVQSILRALGADPDTVVVEK